MNPFLVLYILSQLYSYTFCIFVSGLSILALNRYDIPKVWAYRSIFPVVWALMLSFPLFQVCSYLYVGTDYLYCSKRSLEPQDLHLS